uniref:SVWC domain-containing protein n=1 Tax=Steinernema glaseri TaxID=37863 RepID=A0A1I7ZJG5_9BILA
MKIYLFVLVSLALLLVAPLAVHGDKKCYEERHTLYSMIVGSSLECTPGYDEIWRKEKAVYCCCREGHMESSFLFPDSNFYYVCDSADTSSEE